MEFSDEAVSGAKHDRMGFEALMDSARAGRIDVLYIENLSRLARDCVLTLTTLKELVYNHHVRIVCIDEGIDTKRDDSWQLLAAILGIQNEQYLKTLAKFVFRGQEGLVLDGHCVGDFCFGYSSEPIPGSELQRGGRNAKPQKRYVVDLEKAEWVAKIFNWFVHETRSIRWITRELNRLGAPKDHRATTKEWRHQYVSKLLANTKYIGMWPWGKTKNVRNPLTGKIRQEKRSATETEKWTRHFPDLQIIDDGTFHAAQERLRQNADACNAARRKNGQLCGSTGKSYKARPRHLLAGIVKCGHCDRTLKVGGTQGRYLFCDGYRMGLCSCRATLRRDLAEELILAQIGKSILSHPEWLSQILADAEKAFQQLQQRLPAEIEAEKKKLADLDSRIEKLLDRCEREDDPDLTKRLSQRRNERETTRVRLEQLQVGKMPTTPPTKFWLEAQVSNLCELLAKGGPAAAVALRNLVGGSIVVHEIRTPNRKRCHLQGNFCIDRQQLAKAIGAPSQQDCREDDSLQFVIDFRRPDRYEELADDMKRCFDDGLSVKEICQKYDCSFTLYDRAMNYWYCSRGLKRPDGRSCKKRLKRTSMAEELKDNVMELWSQDLLIQEIAAKLDCSVETVRKAVELWHEQHGKPVPDGRARRREIRLRRERAAKCI